MALVGALAGCATTRPPVTKIVGNKVIVTRSVDPSAYEHTARALLYEQEERPEEAIQELQRALNYDRDAPELHARIAELYLQLDRVAEAAAAVKESLALDETVDGFIAQAHVFQRKGDHPGAVAALRKAIALSSFSEDPAVATDAHLALADAQAIALDIDGARSTLHTLVDAAPASTQARVRLAAVAWAIGDVAEAETSLRQTLTLEPNHLEAVLMLAWLQAAQGQTEKARVLFRDALDRSEGAVEIGTAFARFLVSVGEQPRAAQLADELAPDAPDDTKLLARIDLERAAHRSERALELARTRRNAPDATDELRARLDMIVADILADRGEKDAAVALLVAVPKSTASFGEARLRAAFLLREQGKTTEASRLLDEALTGPRNEQLEIEVAVAQALTDEKAGAPVQARQRLDQILTKHPGSARLLITKAALLERQGRWRDALAVAETILAADPASAEALNFWGYVAADNGHDLPRARQRVRAALILDPGSGAILDSVGWTHLRAGDLPQATLFLEQASRLEPEDPEILGHLATLYTRRGDRDRAEKALRKALTGKPDDPIRKRLEEQLQQLVSAKRPG